MGELDRELDIGCVYRRGGELFLAVAPDLLVGGAAGELKQVRPRTRHPQARGVSVGDLCAAWGVDLDALDALTAEHLPRPRATVRRTRAPRRPAAEREHAWEQLRRHRLRAA